MKRLRPPQIIDPPRPRLRALSAEERELWDTVARQIKPLRPRARLAKPESVVSDAPALPPMSRKPAPPPSLKPSPVKASKPASPPAPPLAPLGRRERSQLSRGRKEIDARLHLHGMTQERAQRALATFRQRASYAGFSFVLIITGKGRAPGPGSERGILR